MKQVIIYVNGIRTWPGNDKNWNLRAVTWTHINTDYRAEALEYFTLALTRWLRDSHRADKLAKKLTFYLESDDYNFIHLVGHSNGCDVICDALRTLDYTHYLKRKIGHISLLSPACSASMEKNGLQSALEKGFVKNLTVGIAQRDIPLRLAATLPAKLMGYGTLGLSGPKFIRDSSFEIAARKTTVVHQNWGHGGWFAPENFELTMRNTMDYIKELEDKCRTQTN